MHHRMREHDSRDHVEFSEIMRHLSTVAISVPAATGVLSYYFDLAAHVWFISVLFSDGAFEAVLYLLERLRLTENPFGVLSKI